MTGKHSNGVCGVTWGTCDQASSMTEHGEASPHVCGNWDCGGMHECAYCTTPQAG
jgi:hypothetical protein